jgi:RNA polymerase sigma-70 factor (ECF subfamily)
MEVSAIYSEFHSSLLTFIKSKVRSKEDAEDILQNVFIKISANISSLSDDKKLTSWIYSIARNAIIDYYRSNANKRSQSLDERLEEVLPEETAANDAKGLDECLGGMIAQLPDDYKTIILDSEIEGISQKELAVKYDMAYPTVRSRVQRGRERLKQLLNNCCHIEADKHGNILNVDKKSDCGDACNSCSE